MLPPEVGEKETLAVQTGEGLLAVLRLQRAGRRSLTAAEFMRGQRDILGRRLGS
jgi:methionyl-tRNA formyltransferase